MCVISYVYHPSRDIDGQEFLCTQTIYEPHQKHFWGEGRWVQWTWMSVPRHLTLWVADIFWRVHLPHPSLTPTSSCTEILAHLYTYRNLPSSLFCEHRSEVWLHTDHNICYIQVFKLLASPPWGTQNMAEWPPATAKMPTKVVFYSSQ